MANYKTGLIYYKVDTDRYQDIKIKRLKRIHGGLGLAVYDFLLCEIYREKGSYLEWNEYVLFDISEYFGIKEELLIEIIEQSIEIKLFDKGMFYKHHVLTSKSIQTRYVKICTDAKRKGIIIPDEINLLKVPEESIIIPEESAKAPEESTEIPEKPAKVPERKKLEPNLSIVPEDFRPIVEEWLAYKKSRKESYKSDKSIGAFSDKLQELASGCPETAQKIIKQSMANNWAGIFELKNETNRRSTQAEQRIAQAEQRKRIILAEAAEISGRN